MITACNDTSEGNMSSQIPPFGLRLPPELKAWLQEQADKNHRSLNGEITKRLEDSWRAERKAKESKKE